MFSIPEVGSGARTPSYSITGRSSNIEATLPTKISGHRVRSAVVAAKPLLVSRLSDRATAANLAHLPESTIMWLDGVVDIYMPDFKFWKPETAQELAKAADYPEVARTAIKEM